MKSNGLWKEEGILPSFFIMRYSDFFEKKWVAGKVFTAYKGRKFILLNFEILL